MVWVLYDLGKCVDGLFLVINCVMFSVDIFEEDMFGCEGGVCGWFLFVDGGMFFLDEIGVCLMLV